MEKLSFAEYQERMHRAYSIAERTRKMIIDRARTTCREAGLDSNLLGIHPHNAMCCFRDGKPWKGVDYSKVRLTLRLLDLSFVPDRIVSNMHSRLIERVV